MDAHVLMTDVRLSGPLTVALLEDDMILCLSLETVFEGQDLHFVHGNTPEALLRELDATNAMPDILVADYHLGKYDKAPILVREILAALGRAVPVIITTGDDSTLTRMEIRDAGWHYVAKPYHPETLREMIVSLVARAG